MLVVGHFGIAAIFLIIALFFYFFPPKSINYLYGYRTKRSMANEDVWKVANEHSAKSFLALSIGLIVFAIIFTFLPFGENGLLIFIVVLLLGLFITIYLTEKYLNKHFDKTGNRK